jgi:hypothetical protein
METKNNQSKTEKKVWVKPAVVEIKKNIVLGTAQTGGDAKSRRS